MICDIHIVVSIRSIVIRPKRRYVKELCLIEHLSHYDYNGSEAFHTITVSNNGLIINFNPVTVISSRLAIQYTRYCDITSNFSLPSTRCPEYVQISTLLMCC